MASKGNEHRMVFDIRGKRRHVVKVVYAILALLMGLSLFLVVGPVNIGSLIGSESSSESAAKQFEEQAEKIEVKLKKAPEDADLLAALTRTRINAGNSGFETTAEGEPVATAETIQQYQLASEAWSKYLDATDEPSANLAQLIAEPLSNVAFSSASEFEANMKAAAEAQKIVAEKRPTINSLTSLAIYQYFGFEPKAAKKSEAEAIAMTKDKFERESLEQKLQPYEIGAQEIKQQLKAIEKEQSSASAAGGKESLQNPLGGGGLGE